MQITATPRSSVSLAPRTLLSRGYVRRLELEGVKKFTASHLKMVRKLDAAYEEARAEVDALPGSLMSQALSVAR